MATGYPLDGQDGGDLLPDLFLSVYLEAAAEGGDDDPLRFLRALNRRIALTEAQLDALRQLRDWELDRLCGAEGVPPKRVARAADRSLAWVSTHRHADTNAEVSRALLRRAEQLTSAAADDRLPGSVRERAADLAAFLCRMVRSSVQRITAGVAGALAPLWWFNRGDHLDLAGFTAYTTAATTGASMAAGRIATAVVTSIQAVTGASAPVAAGIAAAPVVVAAAPIVHQVEQHVAVTAPALLAKLGTTNHRPAPPPGQPDHPHVSPTPAHQATPGQDTGEERARGGRDRSPVVPFSLITARPLPAASPSPSPSPVTVVVRPRVTPTRAVLPPAAPPPPSHPPASPTPAPTPTGTPSPTPTPTPTPSPSPTPTATPSPSPSPSPVTVSPAPQPDADLVTATPSPSSSTTAPPPDGTPPPGHSPEPSPAPPLPPAPVPSPVLFTPPPAPVDVDIIGPADGTELAGGGTPTPALVVQDAPREVSREVVLLTSSPA